VIVGLGVDVVDVDRVKRLLRAHGDRLLDKVCTPGEAAYVRAHVDGAQRLAVRLAAKEAAFKALAGSVAARAIGWREIEVTLGPSGEPALLLHGRAHARSHELGAGAALVSLSHSDAVAVAVVVLEGA
jgi:holo-[acyl-carrier protein] synthase